MSRSTVSVIIPTYNDGQFVGHAVESVLDQSCGAVELIVVDDGSTDGTMVRLGPYRDRVRLVRRDHGGASAARNHGARLARGEWLAFLDADDFWYPHKLSEQLDLVARHPALDFVTGNYHVIDEGGRVAGEAYVDHPMVGTVPGEVDGAGAVFGPEAGDRYVRDRFGILSTTLVRRELFHRVGGFNERLDLAEDLHLMFRLVARGRSFGTVRLPVAAYRRRRESLSHQGAERRHDVTIRALVDLAHHHRMPAAMSAAIREQVAEARLDLAYLRAREGRRFSAMASAARSLLGRPCRRALRALVSVHRPVREDPQMKRLDEVDPVELFRFGAMA